MFKLDPIYCVKPSAETCTQLKLSSVMLVLVLYQRWKDAPKSVKAQHLKDQCKVKTLKCEMDL